MNLSKIRHDPSSALRIALYCMHAEEVNIHMPGAVLQNIGAFVIKTCSTDCQSDPR